MEDKPKVMNDNGDYDNGYWLSIKKMKNQKQTVIFFMDNATSYPPELQLKSEKNHFFPAQHHITLLTTGSGYNSKLESALSLHITNSHYYPTT